MEAGNSGGNSTNPPDRAPDEIFDDNANPPERVAPASEKPTHAQIVSSRVRYGQEIIRGLVCLLLLFTVIGILWFSAYYAANSLDPPTTSSATTKCLPVAISEVKCPTETTHWADVKDWMQIALPTMSSFLGIALGFYFSTIIIEIERRR